MKRLFWENPYLAKMKTIVQKIDGQNILLDQTIIYSFSGGQESDNAKINGIPVIDSKILGNKDIQYTLELVPDFNVGDEVEMEIDWEKRYRIMRLHSTTHIALAIFYDLIGEVPISGADVTTNKGRVEFKYDEPISNMIPDIQNRIDDIIQKNLPIITERDFDSANPEGRIWRIDDISDNWIIECGGLHPKYTEEIGRIKVKRKNTGASKERLDMTFV